MSSNDIRNGIVRILKPSAQTKLSARTAGTGFIVSTRLIVTCAHVVKFAGATPGSKVRCAGLLDEQEFDALVDEQYWRDPEQEDIAFLRVDESFAEDFSLKLGTSAKITDHAFSSYGFPATLSKELQVRGTILGETVDRTRLILRTTDVVEGVSGAPVFDQHTCRVVGMVVERIESHMVQAKQEFKIAKGVDVLKGSTTVTIPTGRLADLAYAIPSHVLLAVCPKLSLKDICPYRGLLPFEEAYANFFYGRDRLINKLLDNLRHNPRFLAVVGSSGSGKSSVVQAGLFPRIRHGDIPGWQDIQIIKFRPSNDPKQALGNALENALTKTSNDSSTPNIVPSSSEAASDFWITLHQQIQSQQTRTIIFADQFEELFALCSAEVQKDFTQKLLDPLKSNLPVTLILTIRADFYEPLLQSILGEWLEVGQVNVLEMSEVELRETILKPAQDVGLQLEPGLADLIIRDLETTKNPLPLLEFTLEKLWEIEHVNNLLTCKCYGEIGGVTGAIAQWADDTYRSFNKTDQDLARKIFTRLIQYNSYNFSDTPDTKKKLPFTELLNLSTDKTDIQKLVNSLADRRLLVTGISEATGEKSIEIIHEALVQEWKLLQKWIQENREKLIQRQKIETAAKEWRDRQKASDYLLQGRQLTEARRFLKQQTNILNISSLTEEYLRRSIHSRRINRLKLWGFSLILPVGLIIPVVTQVLTQIATNIKLSPYWQTLRDAQDGENKGFALAKALEELNRERVPLRRIRLPKADLPEIDLRNANLDYAKLPGANLEGANLTEVRMIEANLRGANLRNANLSEGNFAFSDFSNANLSDANLTGADLTADLTNANLSYANFSGTTIGNADLSGANLSNADLSEAAFDMITYRGGIQRVPSNDSPWWREDLPYPFSGIVRKDLYAEIAVERLEKAKLCHTKLPEGVDLDPNRDCAALGIPVNESASGK